MAQPDNGQKVQLQLPLSAVMTGQVGGFRVPLWLRLYVCVLTAQMENRGWKYGDLVRWGVAQGSKKKTVKDVIYKMAKEKIIKPSPEGYVACLDAMKMEFGLPATKMMTAQCKGSLSDAHAVLLSREQKQAKAATEVLIRTAPVVAGWFSQYVTSARQWNHTIPDMVPKSVVRNLEAHTRYHHQSDSGAYVAVSILIAKCYKNRDKIKNPPAWITTRIKNLADKPQWKPSKEKDHVGQVLGWPTMQDALTAKEILHERPDLRVVQGGATEASSLSASVLAEINGTDGL